MRSRIETLQTAVAELVEAPLSVVEVIPGLPIVSVVNRGLDDDKFLACAVSAQADWIVSGDNHLLSLKHYEGIPILTPR